MIDSKELFIQVDYRQRQLVTTRRSLLTMMMNMKLIGDDDDDDDDDHDDDDVVHVMDGMEQVGSPTPSDLHKI